MAPLKLLDAIIAASETNRSAVESDIDNDAVAKVFGRDGKVRVLGFGMGVSKTTIQHSAPYKRALEEEYEDEIKQVLSQGGVQHSSTCHESSSQAHDGFLHEKVCTGTNQNNTSHTRVRVGCSLNLRKEITIAVGRVMDLSIDEGAAI